MTATSGAHDLLVEAARAGVRVCFVNPGTTELPIVAAFERVPDLRAVLCASEGVVTGAADGYGRMAAAPALTLMHLGPSLANGLANLHNARRARTPIVNLVGNHPAWLVAEDPPLAMDIEALARCVSGFVRTSRRADEVVRDVRDAIAAAAAPPGTVATLIVPADCLWGPAGPAGAPSAPLDPAAAATERAPAQVVDAAARALGGGNGALLLGGHALRRRGLLAAGRIAAATGCQLFFESFPARLELGPELPKPERLPYVAAHAEAALARFQSLVLAGANRPAPFFADPGGNRQLLPAGLAVLALAPPESDVPAILEALADAVGAPAQSALSPVAAPARPQGALAARTAAEAIGFLAPEGAIVVDEGVSAAGLFLRTAGHVAVSYLSLTGGACGQGLPCALGAALACPDRKVIAIEGDGSALYTIQALWTQAREAANVVNVIFANDRYRILDLELQLLGAGAAAGKLTALTQPAIDWVALAQSLGVPAEKVDTTDKLLEALGRGLAASGPSLIEVRLQGR